MKYYSLYFRVTGNIYIAEYVADDVVICSCVVAGEIGAIQGRGIVHSKRDVRPFITHEAETKEEIISLIVLDQL